MDKYYGKSITELMERIHKELMLSLFEKMAGIIVQVKAKQILWLPGRSPNDYLNQN